MEAGYLTAARYEVSVEVHVGSQSWFRGWTESEGLLVGW